jgi:FKBP-type peptidyl-prolyl cis-trans isomerase FklB
MTLRHLTYALLLSVTAGFVASCDSDEETTWDKYRDWRETNNQWIKELQEKKNPDGSAYYKAIVPEWNPSSFVLMHFIENDNPESEKAPFYPLYSSTCDVRYKLYNCNDSLLDSSTSLTTWGKGIFRAKLNSSSLINGWSVALMNMCVGDSCEVVIPYDLGYGSSSYGSVLPYSNLRFNLRLVDIPYYETTAH